MAFRKSLEEFSESERLEFDNVTYEYISTIDDVNKLRRLEKYMSLEGFEPTAEAARQRLDELGAGKELEAHIRKEADEDLRDFRSDLIDWENALQNRDGGTHVSEWLPENGINGFEAPIRGQVTPQPSQEDTKKILNSKLDAASDQNRKDGLMSNACGFGGRIDGKSPGNTERLATANSEMPEKQKQWLSEREKEKGNEYFRAKDYDAAIESYTLAIKLCPGNGILHTNRSAAYLKLCKYEYAETDSTLALECDKNLIKGWLRRAVARYEMKKHQEALQDVENGLRIDSSCKDLIQLREKCASALKLLESEKSVTRMLIVEDSDDEDAIDEFECDDSLVRSNNCNIPNMKKMAVMHEEEEEIEEIFNPMIKLEEKKQPRPSKEVLIEEIKSTRFR